MSNPVGKGPDPAAIKVRDPFAEAFISKFNTDLERKREFLKEMQGKLSPEVWGQLGKTITEKVMAAPAGQLDRIFDEVQKGVDNYMKAGGTAATGRMGLDSLLNAESSPVLSALDQAEKFIGTFAQSDKKEA